MQFSVTMRYQNSPKGRAMLMSARWRQREQKITGAVLAAEHETAISIYRQAQIMSSGGAPASYLKKQHPGIYSVKLGQGPGPAPDYIINAQTSRLKRSWRVYVKWMSDGTELALWNTAPYAKFLASGTRRMRWRGLISELIRREAPKRLARLRRAKETAMKG